MKSSFLRKASFLLTLIPFALVLYEACFASKPPQIWNLSMSNAFFVGREAKLEAMHSFFNKSGHILALTGGPGFGKTQIAKKYAQQFQETYDLIWWFDAQQDIPSQFEKLTNALNHLLPEKEQIMPSKLSKDALIDRVKDILRVKNITYLLIFDNAESYAQVEKYIPYTCYPSKKHVLLTSRYANIWTDKIEVGKFERKESICLIKKTLPKERNEDIERLAEALSDYPLGLMIAVGFIKSSPMTTIPKYLSMHMKRTLRKGEKKPSTLLDDYTNDARTTIEISLKFVEESSRDALDALLFMSLLNSKDIPEIYIEYWLKQMKSSLTADEAVKYIYEQSLIDVSEKMEFDLTRKSKGTDRMHYLSIHDLIHQLVNEHIPLEEKRKLINAATDVMLEVFSGPSEVFTKKIIGEPVHLLHAQKLCKTAKEVGYSSLKFLHLRICMFQCLMSAVRDFEGSELLLKDIELDLGTGLQPDPYYQALYEINRGFLESLHTHYDSAIQHMKKSLALFEAFNRPKEEKLRVLTNLIQYHAMQGEIEKAEELMRTAQPLFLDTQSVVPKSFFLYANSIVFNDQGKFKDSEEVLNKVNGFPSLGKESPTIDHAILLQKTATYIKQKNFKAAKEALQECKKKTQAFFQNRNNSSLSHILLLESFIEMGSNQVSLTTLQNLEKALSLFNDFFKGERKQRRQANTYFAIGKAYTLKKDYGKALEHYLISDEIYTNVLINKKIDDVSDLYTELALLGVKMKDANLTRKYLKAHTKTFGLDHPRTKEIFQCLDGYKLPPS